MSTSDLVAILALIISLVALLATSGQLLQQYFATADGYRRCQPSVMGLWGHRTKLKWRWRQFRFETIYYVPSISVNMADVAQLMDFDRTPSTQVSKVVKLGLRQWDRPDLRKVHVVTGRMVPDHWWESPAFGQRPQSGEGGEIVCWVDLLDRLYLAQGKMNTIYWPPSVVESLGRQAGTYDTIHQTLTCWIV